MAGSFVFFIPDCYNSTCVLILSTPIVTFRGFLGKIFFSKAATVCALRLVHPREGGEPGKCEMPALRVEVIIISDGNAVIVKQWQRVERGSAGFQPALE